MTEDGFEADNAVLEFLDVSGQERRNEEGKRRVSSGEGRRETWVGSVLSAQRGPIFGLDPSAVGIGLGALAADRLCAVAFDLLAPKKKRPS